MSVSMFIQFQSIVPAFRPVVYLKVKNKIEITHSCYYVKSLRIHYNYFYT